MRVSSSTFSLLIALIATALACSSGGPGSGADARRDDESGLTGTEAIGRVEGRVTVGPLCPVERIPPDPRCLPTPEMFAAIKVLVLRPSGDLVESVDLDNQGRYSVDLDPGDYKIDTSFHGPGLPPSGRSGSGSTGSGQAGGGMTTPPGGASGDSVTSDSDGGPYRVLPIPVTVEAGRTIQVDIDIDTGIR